MQKLNKFIILFGLFLLISCSQTYENLINNSHYPQDKLSKNLLDAYKDLAVFEATQMHDWNSAKLYSEKALAAASGKKILPQEISYWKINNHKISDLNKSYDNLMVIYDDAVLLDPYNLAIAITSIDCWSEQEEEGWQEWDINKCKKKFIQAMHNIYNKINDRNKKKEDKKVNLTVDDLKIQKNDVTLVTENIKNEVLQIIYFDFDKSNLSSVSLKEIKNFIHKNNGKINKYVIVGHTDTIGSKEYNKKLSLERAKAVKKILIKTGININNISIFGRGEDKLMIKTHDEIANPLNRRAEISPLN